MGLMYVENIPFYINIYKRVTNRAFEYGSPNIIVLFDGMLLSLVGSSIP
jgi:hypothetical protein